MPSSEDEDLPSPAIGEFAKLLVKWVRDDTIPQCDIHLRPNAKSAGCLAWKKLDPKSGLKSVANAMIPDVVDDAVFHLLHAIDNAGLKLSFTASSGKTLYLPEDGNWEMAGWYAGGYGGWIPAYSKERYNDYLADLPKTEYEGMGDPELEEFADLLVKKVRDEAIRACDGNLRPNARGLVARRWKKLDPPASPELVAETLIPDVVDETIFQLLHAIDRGVLRLWFTRFYGQAYDLLEEGLGKLAGWYMGSPGWRSAYSKERYIDNGADLGQV